MRRSLPRFTAALLMLACTFAQAALPADLGRKLLDNHIRPATSGLVDAAHGLERALRPYCEQPRDRDLRATVEARFSALVAAWSRAEVLRFGPLIEDNRFEKFFFFPDPRGVTLRQVQALLAAGEPQRIGAEPLRNDSVALQGIPALEYALYGGNAAAQIEADAAAGRYRCAYAQAIAANLHRLAIELQAGWARDAAIAREFAAPGPARSIYRSRQEVATEVLKALSTALQYVRDSKLLPALGDDVDSARPRRAPLWRSDQTTAALAANLDSLLALYDASGLATALAADQQWIDGNVRAEAANAIAALEAVTPPFEQAVADDGARARLVEAALVIKNLQSTIVEYLAPALGVNLGFNALDGD